ncbi:hypothetical protein ALI144C_22560 [Actinosynnema sp. ALI-1.44]|uniref:hypothetical protein n=1 Tax=Actinosynnema sp. ALI-1.44 TaxID=1933779 RepID=UPI00097CBE9C|nr:hypothetical protein [Actinosynnema sp. ALI-1.44]ONI81304.1 hypothetical protein ALI144C_22560 [Actinosynnema sp. ALI-1.44]
MMDGYSLSAKVFVRSATVVGAMVMLVFGVWMRIDPAGFAQFAQFPNHVHFLHDAGVFQIGIGLVLLAALVWRDVLSIALSGFFITNTLHAVNHATDLELGGSPQTWWQLGIVSLLALAGLVVHRRQLKVVRTRHLK